MRKWMLSILIFLASPVWAEDSFPIEKLQLPPGFQIEVWADNVPNAREMVLGDKGTLFVGTRDEGNVYAIVEDTDNPGHKQVKVIASGLTLPNGVAMRQGALYVATVNSVMRYDNIEENLDDIPEPVVINDSYPSDTHHGWKFIRFSPDGQWLYIPVGAPCNVCLHEEQPLYASLTRMKPDGSEVEIYATGIRNTVGFDWDPRTGFLWFTDNGRDLLGDDIPPDELNVADKKGLDYGFPYFYGNDIPDPEYAAKKPDHQYQKPALEIQAHSAALGITFYQGDMFPQEYQGRAIIAEHGSWNRTKKVGYRLIYVTISGDKVTDYQPFVTGWLQPEERVIGRPVAILNMPDGSILVSDDMRGLIYRISYESPVAPAEAA